MSICKLPCTCKPPIYGLAIATAVVIMGVMVVEGFVLYDEVFNRLRNGAIDLQLTETATAVTRIDVTAAAAVNLRERIFDQLRLTPWGLLSRENASAVLFERMLPTLLSYIVNSDVIQGTEVAIMLPSDIEHQRNATAYVLCSVYYDILDANGTRAYYIIVVAPSFKDQLYLRITPDEVEGMLHPTIQYDEAIVVVNESLAYYFQGAEDSGVTVSPYTTEAGQPYYFSTAFAFQQVGPYLMEVAVYALLDSWYSELVALASASSLLIIVDPLTNVVMSTNDEKEIERQRMCYTSLGDFFNDKSCIRRNFSSINASLIETIVSGVIAPEWATPNRAVPTTVHEMVVKEVEYLVIVSQLANNDKARPIFIWASPVSQVFDPLRRQTIFIVALVVSVMFVVVVLMTVVSLIIVARPIRGLASKMDALKLVEEESDVNAGRRASLVREIASLQMHYADLARSVKSFLMYVPKTVVADVLRDQLVAQPSLFQAQAAVMFVDMTGFTVMWAAQENEEIASAILTRYFDAVVGALTKRGAVIDKYIGDIVMCMWRLKEDAQMDQCTNALYASIEVREAVEQDSDLRSSVEVNVGCHVGSVLMGNVGSPHRINFTILSDTVNTASRVLKKSRDFRNRRLASKYLIDACGHRVSEFELSNYQPFHLKGKSEQVWCCTYRRKTDESHEPLESLTLESSLSMTMSMSISNIYALDN